MKRYVTIRIIIGSGVFAAILELAHSVSGFWLKSLIAAVAGVGGAFALALMLGGITGAQCDWKNWRLGVRVLLGGIVFGVLWPFAHMLSEEWLRMSVAGLGGAALVLSATAEGMKRIRR